MGRSSAVLVLLLLAAQPCRAAGEAPPAAAPSEAAAVSTFEAWTAEHWNPSPVESILNGATNFLLRLRGSRGRYGPSRAQREVRELIEAGAAAYETHVVQDWSGRPGPGSPGRMLRVRRAGTGEEAVRAVVVEDRVVDVAVAPAAASKRGPAWPELVTPRRAREVLGACARGGGDPRLVSTTTRLGLPREVTCRWTRACTAVPVDGAWIVIEPGRGGRPVLLRTEPAPFASLGSDRAAIDGLRRELIDELQARPDLRIVRRGDELYRATRLRCGT